MANGRRHGKQVELACLATGDGSTSAGIGNLYMSYRRLPRAQELQTAHPAVQFPSGKSRPLPQVKSINPRGTKKRLRRIYKSARRQAAIGYSLDS